MHLSRDHGREKKREGSREAGEREIRGEGGITGRREAEIREERDHREAERLGIKQIGI
jgi:hypothetical protein